MVAGLAAWHDQHDLAAAAIASIDALPAHATLETYSVLTRLPRGLAVEGVVAARVLGERFAATPLTLAGGGREGLLARLAAAGVRGGAAYDGLVALEADAHGQELVTLDARAAETYDRLGVRYRLLV